MLPRKGPAFSCGGNSLRIDSSDAARSDVTQHRIQRGPALAIGNWVDPDKNAIHAQQLRTHLFDHVVGIHGWFGADIAARESLEYTAETARLRVSPPGAPGDLRARAGPL